jgi:hypothetical protein
MKSHCMRRLAMGLAALATIVGTIGLPATQAQAQPGQPGRPGHGHHHPSPCARIIAVCGFDVEGDVVLLFEEEPAIVPPLLGAVNNDTQTWCFYAEPGFVDTVTRLDPGEHEWFYPAVVQSARPVEPLELC